MHGRLFSTKNRSISLTERPTLFRSVLRVVPERLGMPKKDLDCLDRFYVAVMTITLGLVLFLIVTLVRNTMGDSPLYLYSVMDPKDHWPVTEYQVPQGEKPKGNYTPPHFLTGDSTLNRVVEFYAVSSHFQIGLFLESFRRFPDAL